MRSQAIHEKVLVEEMPEILDNEEERIIMPPGGDQTLIEMIKAGGNMAIKKLKSFSTK